MLTAIDNNPITIKFPCIRTLSFFPVISSKSPVARLASHAPERHSSNDTLSGGKKTHFLFRPEVESSTRSGTISVSAVAFRGMSLKGAARRELVRNWRRR